MVQGVLSAAGCEALVQASCPAGGGSRYSLAGLEEQRPSLAAWLDGRLAALAATIPVPPPAGSGGGRRRLALRPPKLLRHGLHHPGAVFAPRGGGGGAAGRLVLVLSPLPTGQGGQLAFPFLEFPAGERPATDAAAPDTAADDAAGAAVAGAGAGLPPPRQLAVPNPAKTSCESTCDAVEMELAAAAPYCCCSELLQLHAPQGAAVWIAAEAGPSDRFTYAQLCPAAGPALPHGGTLVATEVWYLEVLVDHVLE